MTRLGFEDIRAAGLKDWAHLRRTLRTLFRTADFAQGLELVNSIGAAAEEADHHPDLTLTDSAVEVTLTSHDAGGLTERDVELARTISRLAADLGVTADTAAATTVDLALDVHDVSRMATFWAVATGFEAEGDAVQDAELLHPELWLQQTDSNAPDRQRYHLDLSIARDQVEERIHAIEQAGGRLVDEQAAPRFWVLEDPEGNRFCLCTPEGREP